MSRVSLHLHIVLASVFSLVALGDLCDMIPDVSITSFFLLVLYLLSAGSLVGFLALQIAHDLASPAHTRLASASSSGADDTALARALRWRRFYDEEPHGLLLLVMTCIPWFLTVLVMSVYLVMGLLLGDTSSVRALYALLARVPVVGTVIALLCYLATVLVLLVLEGHIVYTALRAARRLYRANNAGFVENGVLLGQGPAERTEARGAHEEDEDGEFGAWKDNQGAA